MFFRFLKIFYKYVHIVYQLTQPNFPSNIVSNGILLSLLFSKMNSYKCWLVISDFYWIYSIRLFPLKLFFILFGNPAVMKGIFKKDISLGYWSMSFWQTNFQLRNPCGQQRQSKTNTKPKNNLREWPSDQVTKWSSDQKLQGYR